MGIFNETHNKKIIEVNNNITDRERIHLNLIRTINHPISNLIHKKIYPQITDFATHTGVSSAIYNEKTYINTLVKHTEVKPDENSMAALIWASRVPDTAIRNYSFTVIVYVRSDSHAIGSNLEIEAIWPDHQFVSKIIISFHYRIGSLYIHLAGTNANIPTNGYIEILYYGI